MIPTWLMYAMDALVLVWGAAFLWVIFRTKP